MDYDFLRDITGKVQVRFSMGHEVIGYWFNEEVRDDLSVLDKIEAAIAEVKGSERQWQLDGHEYQLLLGDDEVMIRSNQLDFEGDEIEEGMNYYDEESLSFCGVEDFLLVIAKYRAFITTHR